MVSWAVGSARPEVISVQASQERRELEEAKASTKYILLYMPFAKVGPEKRGVEVSTWEVTYGSWSVASLEELIDISAGNVNFLCR